MSATRFKRIQLYKKDVLGIGSYGSVCKAECDDLKCAAKIIHPTLITDNPAEKSPQGRFRAECEFLSTLRHPNVVQYLGTWQDPATNLPVLLMELMDQSLTHFLEKSHRIPLYTEISICHDIALALSFLHSNGIIHRDLSSNNVLMIGDVRAKVTDFGMEKFSDLRSSMNVKHTSFTLCPETDAYMPPEAVKDNPKYTEKIDCFSYGVLIIQILNRKFPNPGERVKTVFVGGRELLELQSELSRREEDINAVDANHPLLIVARDCLKDKESDRPSATVLCDRVENLKEAAHKKETLAGEKDHEIDLLKKEFEERIQSLERAKNEVIKDLLERLSNIVVSKDKVIEDLLERLSMSDVQEMVKEIQIEAKSDISEEKPVVEPIDPSECTLRWRKGTDAPLAMIRSSDAVVCGKFVYMYQSAGREILAYDWQAESWSKLPPCPTSYFTLAKVKNSLTIIGGHDHDGEKTNKLYTLTAANKRYTWIESYPPMPTKRNNTAAVSYGEHLIVMGGVGKTFLNIVEVLQVELKQWFTAASLPITVELFSATVTNDYLYILGGKKEFCATDEVLSCSLEALIRTTSEKSAMEDGKVWQFLTAHPCTSSTCISFQNHLFSTGGWYDGCPSKTIWMYDIDSRVWKKYGQFEQARYRCFAAVLPNLDLMVVGGNTRQNEYGETNSSEIATFDSTVKPQLGYFLPNFFSRLLHK